MLKGDKRRQSILDTARRLFFTKGYHATGISDILEQEGCSKGSFYHHFESKLQVLQLLCEEYAAQCFETYLAQTKDLADPLGRLNRLLHLSLPVFENNTDYCALLLPLVDTPEGTEVVQTVLQQQKQTFYPEFVQQISLLRQNQQIFYPCPFLPRLIWDVHTCVFQHLLTAGKQMMTGQSDQNAVYDVLDAARYATERTLDLPFGSIEIISAPLCEQLLQTAADHAAKSLGNV